VGFVVMAASARQVPNVASTATTIASAMRMTDPAISPGIKKTAVSDQSASEGLRGSRDTTTAMSMSQRSTSLMVEPGAARAASSDRTSRPCVASAVSPFVHRFVALRSHDISTVTADRG
jgi:hypothetical protein